MVQGWARQLGLDPALYSGHSMRRTKAAIIGVRSNGVMTVIADWPHVPTQPEVQKRDRRGQQRLCCIRALHADLNHAC